MAKETLVKGYGSRIRYEVDFVGGHETGKRFETLYCVTEQGDVFTCGEVPVSNWFDKPGRWWWKIDALPEGVHFMGNYVTPEKLGR